MTGSHLQPRLEGLKKKEVVEVEQKEEEQEEKDDKEQEEEEQKKEAGRRWRSRREMFLLSPADAPPLLLPLAY